MKRGLAAALRALKILVMVATALVLTDAILRARPVDPSDYGEIGGIFVIMLIFVGLIEAIITGVFDHKRL